MKNSTSIYNLLLLDIETIPWCQFFSGLTEEWKALWIAKISKTMPENFSPDEAYQQKAAILAEFGKVICISTGYFFEDENHQTSLKIKSIYGHDEKELLHSFLQITDAVQKHNKHFQFAGHNIREFDIPYLCRRLLINNMQLPEYMQLHALKPWEVNMTDTMQWWKFGDYKNYITLELLASVLGIPTSKTDMDGSKVSHVYYEEKDLPRIVNYCQQDVVVTANILLRFHNLPVLNEENIIVAM